jgi:hypothetical protein
MQKLLWDGREGFGRGSGGGLYQPIRKEKGREGF